MSLKKFGDKDVFVNTMRAHPTSQFIIFDGKVIYNHIPELSGSRNDQVYNVDSGKGFVSLYEYNIDRPSSSANSPVQFVGSKVFGESLVDYGRIYPWIAKDSARASFKSISQTSYDNEFIYGDILTGSYPLSASIIRDYLALNSYLGPGYAYPPYVSLRNQLNFYSVLSDHYKVSSSYGDKDRQPLNLVSVPSIFYGSRIKKGSISLKWYFTGSLIGELQDVRQNGELIQVGPHGSPGSGSVAGVVLYNEGIFVLTGSWELNQETIAMRYSSTMLASEINAKPKWIYFAAGCNDVISDNKNNATWQSTYNPTFVSASFDMSFKGESQTQVMTMFAHAKRGEVNYSNNPTYIEHGQSDRLFFTSSHVYEEKKDIK